MSACLSTRSRVGTGNVDLSRVVSGHETPQITLPPKAGPEQMAALLVELLKAKFCRWEGSYFLWAENATISKRTKLTASQTKKWLAHAKKQGLTIHFRGRRAFEKWMGNVGGPAYGLSMDQVFKAPKRTRVIVLVELLPERIQQSDEYGAIGLRDAPLISTSGDVQIAPTSAITWSPGGPSHLKENGTEMNLELGDSGSGSSSSLSLITEESEQTVSREPSPEAKPPTTSHRDWLAQRTEFDVWSMIPPDDQARLTEAARSAIGASPLRTLPMFVRARAMEIWQAEHPELFQPDPEPAPEPPRAIAPEPEPKPSPLIEALPGVYVGRPEEAAVRRVLTELVAFVKNPIPDVEFRIGGYADCFSVWLQDPSDGSNRVFRARIRECLWNKGKPLNAYDPPTPPTLSVKCLLYAVLHALGPGTYSRSSKFSAFIKRYRDKFPIEEGKAAAGFLAKVIPAAANSPVTPQTQTGATP